MGFFSFFGRGNGGKVDLGKEEVCGRVNLEGMEAGENWLGSVV